MSSLSRRGFFLTWLGGLLAGWLGRSQAKAAIPAPAPNGPGSATSGPCQTRLPDGTATTAQTFTWIIGDGNVSSTTMATWTSYPR